MKIRGRQAGMRMISGVSAGVMMLPGMILAQVSSVSGDMPRVDPANGNSALISWAIVAAFTLGILFITFKNAKRSHME